MSNSQKVHCESARTSKDGLPAILDALDRMMKTRISGEDCLEPKRKEKRAFSKRTLVTLNAAYAATIRYYVNLLGGGSRDSRPEAVIAGLWRQTGRLLRHYDPALSSRLTSRCAFWSQDSTWDTVTVQKAWVRLNSIRLSANLMDPDKKTLQRWSVSAGHKSA